MVHQALTPSSLIIYPCKRCPIERQPSQSLQSCHKAVPGASSAVPQRRSSIVPHRHESTGLFRHDNPKSCQIASP
eukprot:1649861-Pyramimonas_sp.AAC.1